MPRGSLAVWNASADAAANGQRRTAPPNGSAGLFVRNYSFLSSSLGFRTHLATVSTAQTAARNTITASSTCIGGVKSTNRMMAAAMASNVKRSD